MAILRINDQEHELDVPDDMPLLWVLRDIVGLTGTKFGCGVALCGACTVHLDGRPIRSCITPVALRYLPADPRRHQAGLTVGLNPPS
jgi:isoquinoline 1-oxidoreductase subunit alpha